MLYRIHKSYYKQHIYYKICIILQKYTDPLDTESKEKIFFNTKSPHGINSSNNCLPVAVIFKFNDLTQTSYGISTGIAVRNVYSW